MGKRFLAARYQLDRFSPRRAFLRMNEAEYEPHRMRPYGLVSSKFASRQLFEKKHHSRLGRQAEERATRKAARRFFYNLWCCDPDGMQW